MTFNPIWKTDEYYGALLLLCESGYSDEKAQKSTNARDFCLTVAMGDPEVKLYVNLFKLTDWFMVNGPTSPTRNNELAARTYLTTCRNVLAQHIGTLLQPAIQGMIHPALVKYGTQFTGKLVHTSAQTGAVWCGKKHTGQPHVSSRTLDVDVPLDARANDNTGQYQAIVKMAEGDASVGPSLSKSARDLILTEIRNGVTTLRAQEPSFVDHRLRQILMPSGTDYIALTPLSSGGLNVHLNQTVEQWETQEEGTKKRFRVSFPIGGSKPHNATMYGYGNNFQRPLLFSAPRRNPLREVYRFWFRAWWPQCDYALALQISHEIQAISQATGHSSTRGSVKMQRTQGLVRWIQQCHGEVLDLMELVQLHPIQVDGTDVEVSLEGLRTTRTGNIPILDQCIIESDTGSRYKEALANTMMKYLWREWARSEDTALILSAYSDRERLESTILRELESIA